MMLKNVIICYHGKQLHILKWAIFGWPDIYRSGILCPKFIIFLFVFVDSMTINLVIIKSLEGNELSSGYVKTLIYEAIKIVQWKSNKSCFVSKSMYFEHFSKHDVIFLHNIDWLINWLIDWSIQKSLTGTKDWKNFMISLSIKPR